MSRCSHNFSNLISSLIKREGNVTVNIFPLHCVTTSNVYWWLYWRLMSLNHQSIVCPSNMMQHSSRVLGKNRQRELPSNTRTKAYHWTIGQAYFLQQQNSNRKNMLYFLPINKSTVLRTLSKPGIRGIAEKIVMLWEIGATLWNKLGTLTYNQRRDLQVSDVLPAHSLHLPNDPSPYNLCILDIPHLQYGVFST